VQIDLGHPSMALMVPFQALNKVKLKILIKKLNSIRGTIHAPADHNEEGY
jgi:hypothetical protein